MIKLVPGLIVLVAATLVISGCTLVNQPPLISSLTASPERVNPSASCQVECVASDPNGDELSYTWSANEGSISGVGPVITWTAPAALGDYTIIVEVTDGRGGKETRQLTIGVAVNHPPVIDSLISEWQKVKTAMATTIECVASDPDEDKLSYIWTANGGNISGGGEVVTWVAPNTYGTYTITVTVKDGRGSQATDSIDIGVACCPQK